MKTLIILSTLAACASCSGPNFADGSQQLDGGQQDSSSLPDATASEAPPLEGRDAGQEAAAVSASGDATATCALPAVHPLDLPPSWLPSFNFVDDLGGCTTDHPNYPNAPCSMRWTVHQVGTHVTAQPVSDPVCDGQMHLQACDQGIIAQPYCPLNCQYRVWIYSVDFDLQPGVEGFVATNVVMDASYYSGSGGVAPCARQATPEETGEVFGPQITELFEGLSWPCGPEN